MIKTHVFMFSPADAPQRPSVSVSPSGEIVEGSSVNLTCSSDANPAASYSWYKEDEEQSISDEAQLTLSSIQASDSGQYRCVASNRLGRKMCQYERIRVKPQFSDRPVKIMNIIRLTLVVLMLIPLVVFSRWTWKKTLGSQTGPNEAAEGMQFDSELVYQNISA
ncbi:B-cell receptor CD22 isoform X2 [Fundulus heteroclitus]|uniref:B-cell receptor CD22 isoform X2 n=1 Tax=Fundulus heteroclitus TaxID=8078 RepID=UPI00165B55B0|nr:B-cell receptor CD22 isoform X2 [Fundulus heteroclitus]